MYYTKYRPQKFSEIEKPNDVAKALLTQIKSKKTVHAYLFVGSRGTGKTTMARILAKALNCDHLESDGDPCGECPACLAVQNGNFTDLIEIDAASNRGIDDIRELKEKIKLAPSKGKSKIYIIDEVHMLTTEAFNALLKTLEEPPARVTFILCTTEFHKVPDTIKSRCQIFKFKKATLDQIVEKMKKIIKREKVKIDDHSLKMIASAAQGGFRDAETLLQQVTEGDISVEALISLGTREKYLDFTSYLFKKDTKSALHEITILLDNGVDLFVWTGELLKYFRDLLYVKAGTLTTGELQLDTESVFKRIQSQAQSVGYSELRFVIEAFINAQGKIKDTFVAQLPIELAIIEVCNGLDRSSGSANSEGPMPSGFSSKKSELKADGVTPEKKDVVNETETNIDVLEESFDGIGPTVDLSIVESKWAIIIKEVSNINNTVSALLKTAKIASLEGNKLQLEVPYDFHKERLHSQKNRQIVETKIYEIISQKLIINCLVKKPLPKEKNDNRTGKLTDFNLVPSGISKIEMSDDILDVFDGGLPSVN